MAIYNLGTRVRLKGDKDIDGTIINWTKDDNENINGYEVEPDDKSIFRMFIALDDNFEIIQSP